MRTPTRVMLGLLIFVISTWLRVPNFHHAAWAEALLLFAALVIAPFLLDLVADAADGPLTRRILAAVARLQLPAAILLVFAYAQGPDPRMALRALPWTCVLLLLASVGALRIGQRGLRPWSWLCRDLGLVYAAVGAAWLMADRLGLRPLGFGGAIVLLTAIHFHFAGMIVPVLAGLALQRLGNSRLAAFVGLTVILGVPAVAVGISASQLGIDPAIEVSAVLVMATGGLGLGAFHLRLAFQAGGGSALLRWLWALAGFSLIAGMLFAGLYGLRHFFQPWPWLGIPWMWALHGSINALGFGFCGVTGWWLDRARVGIKPRPATVITP
ncbi:MAG TPA: YndJ family transporter [Opitutaceae bacterium]|nr:YndJ family transporter [Opitutaceae bacterium]